MLTCNGELADKNQRSSNPWILQEDAVAPELPEISLQQWKNQVGVNVSSAYTAPTIQSSINDQYADFANALNCRGETSKFAASIGSCDLSMNHSPFLFDSINEPITTTWDNFEDSLKGVLDPSQIESVLAHISAAESRKKKGVSPTILSKLWCI